MKLVTYYNQDMTKVWDSRQIRYVDRSFDDGPKSFMSLFTPILDVFNDHKKPLQDFLEPYMWHAAPTNLGPTVQELNEAAHHFRNSLLWIQCTMYLCDEQATTFKGMWLELDHPRALPELWDQLQDYGFRMNNLPYIASATIELADPTE